MTGWPERACLWTKTTEWNSSFSLLRSKKLDEVFGIKQADDHVKFVRGKSIDKINVARHAFVSP